MTLNKRNKKAKIRGLSSRKDFDVFNFYLLSLFTCLGPHVSRYWEVNPFMIFEIIYSIITKSQKIETNILYISYAYNNMKSVCCVISLPNAGFNNWCTSRTFVRLLLLAYAWFWTCICWHVRSFFPCDFSKFSKFFGFL